MATLLDWNTTQTQRQIQLEQLGTMNLKGFVALLCGPIKKDAKASYTFTGTKAYVVSTVDPGHGEMSVYVDGQKVADVQTKNASRKRSQKVFETGDLAPGQHTITLVNKTGEPIATEGIYTLNNDSKGCLNSSLPTTKSKKGNQSLLRLSVLVEARGLLLCASSQNLELEFTVKFTKIQLKM